MSEYRELTAEEKQLYEKSLNREREEMNGAETWLQIHKLMQEKGNYQNYLDAQKATKKKIEEYTRIIENSKFIVQDCIDKLEHGVRKDSDIESVINNTEETD